MRRLLHVPVRLQAVNGTEEVFEGDFLVDPASQTLKRLPAISLKPAPVAHTRARGATSPGTSTRVRSSEPTVAT